MIQFNIVTHTSHDILHNTHCQVFTCKCIHESSQGAVHHFEKWIPNRVFLRTTENSMFKNMSYSRIIHWSGKKSNTVKGIMKAMNCTSTQTQCYSNPKALLVSSLARCRCLALVLSWVSCTATKSSSGTSVTLFTV